MVQQLVTWLMAHLLCLIPLNELAAAINDDENFVTTITNLINANETHIDNVATLTGVAKDSANLGTFTGSTIADSSTRESCYPGTVRNSC